jgi:hypothetical protein
MMKWKRFGKKWSGPNWRIEEKHENLSGHLVPEPRFELSIS